MNAAPSSAQKGRSRLTTFVLMRQGAELLRLLAPAWLTDREVKEQAQLNVAATPFAYPDNIAGLITGATVQRSAE